MGDLNINRQMLQALQGQEVQRLATEILADGKVDSADNEKLRALRAELKAVAEADGTIDSAEDSLMDALDSTGLFGTNKEVVKNNLTQLTRVATMDANNFNFNIQTQDGVGGFFGGRQERTVRLDASQNSQTVDPELENALNEAQPSGSTTIPPAEATAPPAGSTTAAPPAEATAPPSNPIPTEPIEVPQNTTMQDRLAYEQQNLSNALQPLEQELQQNTPAARQQIANMLNLDPEDPELAQKVDAKRDELLNAMQAYRQNPAENFSTLNQEVRSLINAYANNPQVDSSPLTMTDLSNLRGALFNVSDADYLAETEQNRVTDGRHTVRSDNTDALNEQLNNVSTAAREDLGNAVEQSSQYVQQLKNLQSTNPALFQEMYPGVSADDIAALESQVDNLRQAVESGEPIGQEQTSQLNRLWGTMDQLEKRQQTPASIQALKDRVVQQHQNSERQAELRSIIGQQENDIAEAENILLSTPEEHRAQIQSDIDRMRATLLQQQNELSTLESGPALSAEEQSLLDAYQDASDDQKIAFRAVRDSFWAVEDSGTERAGVLADLRHAESNIATSLAGPDITPEARQQLEQQQRAIQQARTLIENGETVAFDNPEDQAAFETVLSNLNQTRQSTQTPSVSPGGTSYGSCSPISDPLLGFSPGLGLGYDPLLGMGSSPLGFNSGLGVGYDPLWGWGGSPLGFNSGLGGSSSFGLDYGLGGNSLLGPRFGGNTSLGFSSPFNTGLTPGIGSLPTMGGTPTGSNLFTRPDLSTIDFGFSPGETLDELSGTVTPSPADTSQPGSFSPIRLNQEQEALFQEIQTLIGGTDSNTNNALRSIISQSEPTDREAIIQAVNRLAAEEDPAIRNVLIQQTAAGVRNGGLEIADIPQSIDTALSSASQRRRLAEGAQFYSRVTTQLANSTENIFGTNGLSSREKLNRLLSEDGTHARFVEEVESINQNLSQSASELFSIAGNVSPEARSQLNRFQTLINIPPAERSQDQVQELDLVRGQLLNSMSSLTEGSAFNRLSNEQQIAVREQTSHIHSITAASRELVALNSLMENTTTQSQAIGTAISSLRAQIPSPRPTEGPQAQIAGRLEAQIAQLERLQQKIADGQRLTRTDVASIMMSGRLSQLSTHILERISGGEDPNSGDLQSTITGFHGLVSSPTATVEQADALLERNGIVPDDGFTQVLIDGENGRRQLHQTVDAATQYDNFVTGNSLFQGLLNAPDRQAFFAEHGPQIIEAFQGESSPWRDMMNNSHFQTAHPAVYQELQQLFAQAPAITGAMVAHPPAPPEDELSIASIRSVPLDLTGDEPVAQIAQSLSGIIQTAVEDPETAAVFLESENNVRQVMNTLTEELRESNAEMFRDMISAGIPIPDTVDLSNYDVSGVSSPSLSVSPRTQALINEANALGDSLILAPVPSSGGEEFLSNLINDFIDIIRDLDYKTRQLVLQQLAQQMTNNAITQFYKDKVDEGNDYHQQALDRLSENFREQIERTIESGLASQAESSQGVAAVSGQVTGAALANAIENVSARENIAQMLDITAQMNPPLSQQQQERILDAVTRIMEAGGVPPLTDAQLGLPGLSNPLLRDQVVS